MHSFIIHIGATAALLLPSVISAQSLPQVDLGYEIHQASSFNATGQLYNFSNIRYAQPPVGNLRFAAPVPPKSRNPEIQNGTIGKICPQAAPAWSAIAQQFLVSLLAGNASSFDLAKAEQQLQLALANSPPRQPDPRTTEDCLFLDLIVPQAIFDNSNNRHRRRQSTGGAPVIVWIYGGGYTLGDKAGSGNPSGLIKASQVSGGQGVIYVAMNYRIGALGWLSGPTLQGSGGVSNAGLYDQRLAIEWVAKYIHLFGGDPKRITLLGESAGGGSVEHQITAFGGQKNVSFQQAIPQSPGFVPVASQFTQENTTQTFLSLLNVTSIEEARNMSSAAVIRANTLQVGASPYGGFTYGPVVDGIFAPQLPGLLLNSGQFAKNVKVMVGHNSQESPPFTPPNVRDDTELEAFLRLTYPGMPPTTLSYIIDTLYPAIYNGSQPYTTPLARTFLIIQESVFTCNTNYINKAFNNQTYAYEFQVPPAFHGRDIQYTYYNGQGTNLSVGLIAPVAQALQAYIVNFAMTGNPNGPGVPMFSMQGKNASMQAINATYIVPQVDDTANVRCAWWQKALYT